MAVVQSLRDAKNLRMITRHNFGSNQTSRKRVADHPPSAAHRNTCTPILVPVGAGHVLGRYDFVQIACKADTVRLLQDLHPSASLPIGDRNRASLRHQISIASNSN